MGAEGDDILTQTRLDIAEMKGMLRQALSDQGQRIANLEQSTTSLHGRISDKAKILATHTEQIGGVQRAVNVLENDNRARQGRILGIIAAVVGCAGLALSILNRITII